MGSDIVMGLFVVIALLLVGFLVKMGFHLTYQAQL